MPPRILVADDDDDLRQMLSLIFRHAGFEVVEAADGEQALARAVDSNPIVVLLDVMMPGMNGFDVCRRLKRDQRTDQVPVIFVSAAEDVNTRNDNLKIGADDCIQKPIAPRELVARVKRVLEQRGIMLAAS
jgi:DNA-binding response OmpR family regulator